MTLRCVDVVDRLHGAALAYSCMPWLAYSVPRIALIAVTTVF